MSDTLDGLSNIYAIQANIESLKNAQINSSSSLNNTSSGSHVSPGTFLYQTEQSFNKMLTTLTTPLDDQDESSSTDPFSFLDSSQDSSLNSVSSTDSIKQLLELEQSSTMIGRTVTYTDSVTGEEKSGVISKLSFTSGSVALLILSDGTELAAGSVTSLQ
ncbi:MAG: hypothetical protein PHH60_01425 [Candidatus Margulisbacteria bacterium]|nr:hypothetical protein [Candidatus Margulisiibacteriota bacterium]